MSKKLEWAKGFKRIYDDAVKEMEATKWWELKKRNHIRSKMRWADYHYNKCMKPKKDKSE